MEVTGQSERLRSRRAAARDVRLEIIALTVLAIGQAVLVGVSGASMIVKVLAVAFTLMGVLFRYEAVLFLAVGIVANFILHLFLLSPPYPYRLAQLSVPILYLAVGLAIPISRALRLRYATALAVTGLFTVPAIAAEAAIPSLVPPHVLSDQGVSLTGVQDPDPELGGIGTPYGVVKAIYPSNPRGYFAAAPSDPGATKAPAAFSVEYTFNALGCRGRDYAIPRPAGIERVLLLGGGSAFGMGVHEKDTLAARLEQSLNAGGAATPVHEVINCAADGWSTQQQRVFYERIASTYEPDVVLAVMSEADNLSAAEEVSQGYVHQPDALQQLVLSWRVLQYNRHEARRPTDLTVAAGELLTLDVAARARGARLAVVLFSAMAPANWADVARGVREQLDPTGVPVLDLNVPLVTAGTSKDLFVHPLDRHLNDTAHALATSEVLTFLRSKVLPPSH